MDNICKFIPTARADRDVVTLNFVYEKQTPKSIVKMTAAYSMCIVTNGTGRFENEKTSVAIER